MLDVVFLFSFSLFFVPTPVCIGRVETNGPLPRPTMFSVKASFNPGPQASTVLVLDPPQGLEAEARSIKRVKKALPALNI